MKKEETTSLIETMERSIITLDDVADSMLRQFREGKKHGTKTYVDDIDEFMFHGYKEKAWSWREGELNIWTGYNNEGKSLMFNYLCLLKGLNDGWKFGVFSPENFPPDDFFDDMVHMLTGKTTDRTRHNFSLTDNEYISAIDRIREMFYLVYPLNDDGRPDFTIEKIESAFEFLIMEHDVKAVIVDPFIKINHKMEGDPDHVYASRFTMERTHFTKANNVSYNLVMHQTTPRRANGELNYPKPNLYSVKGGGTYADGVDNVISIWRPNRGANPLDTRVKFISEKIKKQKLVGIPYEVDMDFDRKKNRYTSMDGRDYMDGSITIDERPGIQDNSVFNSVENEFDNGTAPF